MNIYYIRVKKSHTEFGTWAVEKIVYDQVNDCWMFTDVLKTYIELLDALKYSDEITWHNVSSEGIFFSQVFIEN